MDLTQVLTDPSLQETFANALIIFIQVVGVIAMIGAVFTGLHDRKGN